MVIRLFNLFADKKTIDVGWTAWSAYLTDNRWREVLVDMPKKLLAPKEVQGDVRYCPAFGDFYKNTYVLRMPWDISFFKVAGRIEMFMDKSFTGAIKEPTNIASIVTADSDDRVTIQIMLDNLFVSDTPNTIIETLPPILHGLREEIIYTNGRYDCHAWQRPLQLGFQISKEVFDAMNEDTVIEFKKGEVVQYVRINTPNGEKVNLQTLSADDVKHLGEYVQRNLSIPEMLRRFNFAEIITRVRHRRPAKFVRNKDYK
jgi:hypothetical protein